MAPTRQQATLLIFTLGAAGECARQPLLPRPLRRLELDLRQRCLTAAIAAGRGAGCRVTVSAPSSLDLPSGVQRTVQRGQTFDERLRQAVDDALVGAGPVVVVGTDIPGLTASHVRQALDQLADAPERVVVGPSHDGGFYLLAAARPVHGELAAVRWRRRSTLATLVRALRAGGREVVLLEPLGDLDRPADLDLWLAARRRLPDLWHHLVRALRRLLAARRRPPVPAVLGGPAPARIPVPSGRSPPA